MLKRLRLSLGTKNLELIEESMWLLFNGRIRAKENSCKPELGNISRTSENVDQSNPFICPSFLR